jgi:hypothetical protein
MNMNKRVSFSIWYVFLAIWAVILVHDFISALSKSRQKSHRAGGNSKCRSSDRSSYRWR